MADALAALAPGITPEMAAAASKIMRNQDLILVARKVPRAHALSQHHRPARAPVDPAAAEPSDRRPAGIAASCSTACCTAAATR